ncbi:MAG: hypothetical protein J6X18_04725 [Bacteroidales bacterium]|nr:hypothetical protein [Bacteroidales bacterium]
MITAKKQLKQQPTTFEKVERYITKIAEEYGATIEKSPRSRYFKFNDRVLRLSNHIGKNSSGAISIIVPYGSTQKDDVFILHVHSTGNIQTIDLTQLKEFVRTFALVSDFLEPLVNSTTVAYVKDNYQKDKENTILGYPLSSFSEAQINQIRLFIGQNHQEYTPKNRK